MIEALVTLGTILGILRLRVRYSLALSCDLGEMKMVRLAELDKSGTWMSGVR